MSPQLMFAGVTLLAVACRYQPAVVPLAGVPAEVAKLAGDWQGEYTSDDSRRSGNITFRITARGDSAYGDVQMFVPGYNTFPLPWDQPAAHLQHARSSEYLGIHFVAIGNGEVRGELEPYTSPDCDCIVHTQFTGRVNGNEIRGRYLTKGNAVSDRVGRWVMQRVKP